MIRYLFYLSLNNHKISVWPLLQLSRNISFIFSSIIRRFLFYLFLNYQTISVLSHVSRFLSSHSLLTECYCPNSTEFSCQPLLGDNDEQGLIKQRQCLWKKIKKKSLLFLPKMPNNQTLFQLQRNIQCNSTSTNPQSIAEHSLQICKLDYSYRTQENLGSDLEQGDIWTRGQGQGGQGQGG